MSKILMIGVIDPTTCSPDTVQFLSLAEGLSYFAQKIEVMMARPKGKKTLIPLKNKNIAIHTPFKFHRSILLNFFNTFSGAIRITWYAFRKKFDVIYIKSSIFSFLFILLLKGVTKAELVCQFGNTATTIAIMNGRSSWLLNLKKRLQLLSAKWAHRIHTSSSLSYELLLANNVADHKIFKIDNGTHIKRIYPVTNEKIYKTLNLEPDYLYLGFVGTITCQQDLNCALQALALLIEKNLYIKLIIAGAGPELESLRFLTEKLKLENSVIFIGEIPYKDINILLNSFDLALAPFIYKHNIRTDSSSLKIRDYAAAGLPTIMADIPDFKNEYGSLDWVTFYQASNPEKLAETILDLASQTQVRKEMSSAARKHAESHYDWKNLCKEIFMAIKNSEIPTA